MAIGTAAAIGIGLAGVGSAASAISGNRASRRAAQTSQANTDANVGLAREIYGQNRQIMSPFVGRGNVAGNQINALLGLGGGMEMGGPAAATLPGVQPNALSQFLPQNGGMGFNPAAFGDVLPTTSGNAGLPYGVGDNVITTGSNTGGVLTGGQVVPQTPAQTPQQAAENAFNIFRNSTGYQNRFNSAMEGVASLYSGIGGLQSGAAIRGAQDRAADVAGNEFANYMALLGGQQAVGAGAASSLAGVGQNFAGTVINANNLNAQNQMGAQLGQQNALANVAGILGGGLFGYGMGGR